MKSEKIYIDQVMLSVRESVCLKAGAMSNLVMLK